MLKFKMLECKMLKFRMLRCEMLKFRMLECEMLKFKDVMLNAEVWIQITKRIWMFEVVILCIMLIKLMVRWWKYNENTRPTHLLPS